MRASRLEVRVAGRLGRADAERLAPIVARPAGEDTLLTGVVRDRAELRGVLARVRALGLEVVAVRRIPE